ncbi:MmgE/PrpD family protein [Chloroflexota bacterium]
MDAAYSFAQNITNTRFEDIPHEALKAAKTSVLDSLGTALAAGTLAHGTSDLVQFVKEGGGKEESSIIGFGGKVPSWMAALANSTLAHSLDYDDSHEKAMTHGGVTMVPAGFAVAERLGKVSGKNFLTAVVLGMDLTFRLSLATPKEPRDWSPTGLYGFFGTAAVAGKLLGLNAERIQNALGIAYAQASGNRQAINDSALTKRIEVGFSSMGGIISALLAEKGITGALNSLEGEFGLYKLHHRGRYDPAILTSELGKRFEGSNLGFKPYPCPRGTHAAIDATLEMIREYGIKPGDVESITVFKGKTAVGVLGEPIERKRRPTNEVDAQFSLPYVVGTAIVKNWVGLQDFLPQAINDPAVLQIAQKVDVQVYPEFNTFKNTFVPAITEIKTKGGKVFSKRVDDPYGNPNNPMSRDSLVQKFTECASHALKPLSQSNLDYLVENILNLEEVDDVTTIIRMLA